MVRASSVRLGRAERHQTAFRGPAPFPIREGDGRRPAATPQKPLRADEPVRQNSELDPRRVTAPRRRSTGGIETSVASERLRGGRVGSVSGVLGRRAASAGRWTHRGREHCSGRRRGANPSRTGSGMCHSATAGVKPQMQVAAVAVALGAPVRRLAPPPGRSRSVHASRSVHLSLVRGWGLGCVHDARKRFGSKGTCLRHRW
jgi:hypothetical protein